MNTRRTTNVRKFGLLLVLLCIWVIPHSAGAGTAPPIPTGPLDANGNPAVPDYYTTANWANSPPMAKFVDKLPGLGSAKANLLGQYISVAKPDITTYPGTDYYEIDLVEFRQRMHSDLPAPGTLLRGYKQVNRGTNISAGTLPSQNKCGADQHVCTTADTVAGTGLTPDTVRYLGPTIVSERDRPVRIKFTNRLPTGPSGNLFIPVDTTVMGAGTGPASATGTRGIGAPCDNSVEPNSCASYTQNRADIHLHGGRTPWISDGTPHQWITPAGEVTPFTKGVSFQNVPDMPDPGDGSSTYFYTNQQSARLMFYHDHAFGITRLNVYAGEAAGYLITDKYEQDLVTRGIIPADQIPLIIQDKTFVDDTPTTRHLYNTATKLFDTTITVPAVRATDPLWNWGSGVPDANGVRPPVKGDLWLPHVYMPAQTLAPGFGGVNPFGRWMYGPWFYPATAVTKGPVANPYYDADCSSTNPLILAQCTTPGQPTMIPGTPNTSMGMEAFQDSAVVNGTVFPSLTVDPRAYRFRILNAASDRFWNLSFYKADPTQVSPDTRPASRLTEVKMVPAAASLAAANNWPADWPVDGRDGGVPDPGLCTGSGATLSCPNLGPSFLQIGTEGGFLPQPDERFPQPVTYMTDPTAFWVGVVDKTGLALGPAERADVIVDFSRYAGQTLILYNDAPAAWPARVAGYDYYTGAPDLRDSGGYGTGGTFNTITGAWDNGTGPLVGYAPNTRTVMQVIVRSTAGTDPAYTFNKSNLEREFTSAAPVTAVNPTPVKTLFERAQEPIIVGQAAYSTAYPNSYFPPNFPWEGINQINDQFLKFVTLAGDPVIVPTEPKGIHDEMGASFDPVYGRMSGNLAMQLPNPTTLNALLVLYGFSDLPTETIDNSTQLNVTVIPDATTGYNKVSDGTQIWKISHNGVDTHPIHFHIFDVQLINRVGWDGQTLLPEPNELGWKDTVKISPLMDTIVAVRPRAPLLPFGITNSLRPLNPAIPIGSAMGFNSVDWTTGQARVPAVTNILYNFGWEYVWHCHILSHEEMDMMRPIVLNVASVAPGAPVVTSTTGGVITWIDPTPVVYTTFSTYGDPSNEVGFNVYRSTDNITYTKLNATNLPANRTTYTDTTAVGGTAYLYKVEAFNAAGSTFSTVASSLTVSVAASGTLAAPGPVTLTATITGALPNGVTITQIAFYEGLNLIGIDPTPGTAPYAYIWNSATKGTHAITAKVTNSLGAVATSAPVNVIITGTLTASFTATGSAAGANIGFCEIINFTSTSTGSITGYSWLIQGINYLTQNVSASLPIGTTPVTLGITNGATGETAQVTNNVTVVNHNPIAIPGGPYTVVPGGNLTLNGSGTDLLDSCNTTPLTYAWNVDNIGAYDYFTANPTISYNTLFTVLGVGTHTMTFKVTDSNGGVGTATTTVTVFPLTVTTTALANGAVNTPYSQTVAAGGGTPPYTWSTTGLPTGLTINPSTGAISGTPANVVALNAAFATFPVTITVRDSAATPATVNTVLNLRINQSAPAVPSGLAAFPSANQVVLTWTDNANNETGVQVQRATNLGFTIGLTSVYASGVNRITYTDTAVTTGTTYYYRVRSGNFVTWSTTFSNTVTVTPTVTALAIATTSLASGAVNAAYNLTVTATGGTGPNTWSATGLPTGLTINPNTGVISGTLANVVPSNVSFANFSVIITVRDSAATPATVNKALNLRINQSAPATPSVLAATAPLSNRVVLTWTDNANNELGVQVQRATNAAFTTGLISVWVPGINLTTYTDNTVAGVTTYYYRVRSGNFVTWSTTFSNAATVTTP